MRDFVTCLEFLTRIRFSNRTDWHDDDFSRSVPYFPLVGLVMGVFMGAVNYGLYYLHTPDLMRAVMLVLAESEEKVQYTVETGYEGPADTAPYLRLKLRKAASWQ